MTAPDGLHFDRVAPTYARGRPAYPSVLYELLAERSLVGAGVRALEVGAGSGLATAELLARGCRVDAIEPGPHLAAMLRELDHPDLTVLPTSLEEADLSAAAYDVAVAATSLHWVDLDRGLPILHAALRPGGTLVAWWQVFGDPDWHTPFREAVDRLSHRAGIGSRETPRPLQTEARIAELEVGGRFRVTEHHVLPWRIDLTPEQVGDLFTTFPTWSPELVADLVDVAQECGPVVEERYLTVLYLAERTDSAASL